MTSMLFGVISDQAVPTDQNVVRIPTAVVQVDLPAAVQDDMPEPNEVTTDSNPLLGMATRTLASAWHESEQGVPEWIPRQDNDHLHNDLVNARISSAGTAAAREARGEWGRGTAAYAVGIEPTGDLVDGAKFGNEYFAVNKTDIQDPAGNYMEPGMRDYSLQGMIAATGKTAARDAAQSALYNSWYQGFSA